MPIYEYTCADCEQTVEVLVRSREEQTECPQCGGHQLNKEWSVPASPAVRGGQALPVSRGDAGGQACGMPRFLNFDFLKFDFLAGNGDTSSSYIYRAACGLESRGPARPTAANNCTEQP